MPPRAVPGGAVMVALGRLEAGTQAASLASAESLQDRAELALCSGSPHSPSSSTESAQFLCSESQAVTPLEGGQVFVSGLRDQQC